MVRWFFRLKFLGIKLGVHDLPPAKNAQFWDDSLGRRKGWGLTRKTSKSGLDGGCFLEDKSFIHRFCA